MENKDQFALDLLGDKNIDSVNKKFYEKYNFPWSPSYYKSFTGNHFIQMLNQDIGHFNHTRIGENPRIWVAGCGTNQAIDTALKYPLADVLGTDVSVTSLDVCRKNAKQLGIQNLRLEEQSVNSVTYQEEFDYIICTGVIHHNADPQYTLAKLTGALKRNGVMELMVYNYYHRLFTTAIQKGIRALSKSPLDFELQYTMVRKLIKTFPAPGLMANFLADFENRTDAELADCLLQPVEYSYTIETFETLLNSCNLNYLHYCVNDFDISEELTSWHTHFEDAELRRNYTSLEDAQRWQITNLLMLNNSPRLWFYVQRKDAAYERRSEAQICDEFLKITFRKFKTYAHYHFRDPHGAYSPAHTAMPFPTPARPIHPLANSVYAAVDSGLSMREIFTLLSIEPCFYHVNTVRNQLTTVAFPYLIAEE